MGELRCGDNSKNFSITAKLISVMGRFICGSEGDRFKGRLDLYLKAGLNVSMNSHSQGERAFAVHSGGLVC